MANLRSWGLPSAVVLLACLGLAGAQAQGSGPSVSRLAGDWQSSAPLTLAASRPPLSRTGTDQGVAPANQNLGRMLLLLAPSAARQQALSAELAALQDPGSPQYRQWLTPAAFAAQYANSASDVVAVVAWLQSQGFQVAPLPAGRGWIEFSGTVAQAEQAFHIQIHLVAGVGGTARPVAMSDISVPGALLPVIAGLVSLDGVVSMPALTAPQPLAASAAALAAETSPGAAEALTPRLEAQLVDFGTVAAGGITGAGQTIAIASPSNLNPADVASFRAAFGLPASPVIVNVDGPDPGLTGAQAQATLAASWAGAAAPGARIVVVPAATTSATDGVDLSLAAIVDRDLAATASVGYSACEAGMSSAHQAFYSAVYRQAAAEGMAVVAAAGDSGAAACALPGTGAPVTSGFGVNALASTPWDTAVGVAAFGSSGPAALAAWAPRNAADPSYAGGGGSSALYRIPSWQPLPAHLPEASRGAPSRLLPDLSLPTAIDTGANPGLAFCLSAGPAFAAPSSTGCALVRSGGSGAAASLFAGIAALMAQKHGAEGNLAPLLYSFSSQPGVFHDVQQGSAQLKCAAGTPGCGVNGQIGFAAGAGYDLATGLGVLDAGNLVAAQPQANGASPVSVSNTIAAGQTINPSGSVVMAATVTSGTGGAAPTGTVTFYDQTTASNIVTVSLAAASGTSSNAQQTVTGALAAGSHSILVKYSGDPTYAAANSATSVVVNVAPTATDTVVTPATNSPSAGSSFTITAVVSSPGAGNGALAPSGTVTFKVDNVSQGSAQLIAGVASGGGTNSSASISITAPYSSGSHQIVGVYSGDGNYNASTSSAASINVSASTPAVVLTASTTTPGAGSNDTLSVTIAPPGAGSGAAAPTGTVSFTLDGATAGTANVSPGSPSTASFTLVNLSLGTHTVQATYSGDGNYNAAPSNTVTLNASKTSTTLAVTPATTSPAASSSLQVTATLTPVTSSASVPTGTVTFTLDGAPVGSAVSLSGGTTASTTITTPAAGTHTLAATYSGDGNYASSTSAPVTLNVSKLTTTLTITPATTAPSAGSSLQVMATIDTSGSSIAPTGVVTFTLDGVVVATGQIAATSPATASATFTVPSAGSHTLRASYIGDTNYSSSNTSPITLNVSKSTPTMILTPATTSPAAGSNLQLTAQISPPASGAAAPTGTVTFSADGTPLGTALVTGASPASATLTIPTPSGIGVHSLTAVYSGDGNYNSATAPSVAINVTKGVTTLTVTPATTTPTASGIMLVTATISATATGGTVPTGTVSFSMDGAPAGSSSVSGGTTAITTITVPSTGTHTLQATYSGDSNFSGAVSPTATFTVAKTVTTTVLVPSTTAPVLGAALPVTATVSAATPGATPPTGSISFTVDGVTQGVQAVTPGNPATASFTLPSLSPGTHTLAAVYTGDPYYAASTSSPVTVSVPKSPTAMTVTPATTAPSGGSSLAVSATIVATNPGPAAPTGAVNFTLDGATVATSAVVPGSPATATATIPAIAAGNHVLAATYSGDTYYSTATANSVVLTVSKSPTTITVTPSTLTPSAGGSMVVTADISSSNPSTVAPTGTVSISMDGVTVATGTVVPGTPSIATVTLPLVSAGTHILAGAYSGDNFYTASSSSTVAIVASKGATVTSVTATPPSLTAGSAETLTASVAPTNPVTGTTYTITGIVSFYDGVKLLGQVAVANGAAVLSGVPLADNVSHTITAVYSGDTNWTGSTSLPLPLAATTLPDIVVLTANYSVAQPGVAIVLTATVTPTTTPTSTGEQNPTGIVVFYNGTTVMGTAALTPTALSNSSTATLTTQTLPGGQDALTAYYQGDLSYDAATSNPLTLTVQGFSIAPASTNPLTNLNIVQGGSGAISFDVTGQGGFNNQVQLECQAPAQDNITCTATPQQIVPPGTVTFVVQTYTHPQTLARRGPASPLWPGAAGGAALAGLVFFLLPFGRRARAFLGRNTWRCIVLFLLLVGLGGAGIGCTSSNSLAAFGTPLGVATLKVTGQAYVDNTAVSQSIYFTVNVLAP